MMSKEDDSDLLADEDEEGVLVRIDEEAEWDWENNNINNVNTSLYNPNYHRLYQHQPD
jgi:hypothetical protein